MRVTNENEPVYFTCDGGEGGECPNCRTLETPHHEWYVAFEFLQRQGWKGFKNDAGEWRHACPRCYVHWCRRAAIDPYQTSNYVTYDEVKELEGADTEDTTLEPQWYVDKLKAEEAAREAKRKAALQRMKPVARSRADGDHKALTTDEARRKAKNARRRRQRADARARERQEEERYAGDDDQAERFGGIRYPWRYSGY